MGLILKYGGDPNISTSEGSGMHVAIKHDNELVAAYLIQNVKNLDLSLENGNGDNVLFFAARLGLNNIFTMMLERAIKEPSSQQAQAVYTLISRPNKKGDYIIHVLAQQKNLPLLNYLRKRQQEFNVDFEKRNKENKTIADIEVSQIERLESTERAVRAPAKAKAGRTKTEKAPNPRRKRGTGTAKEGNAESVGENNG